MTLKSPTNKKDNITHNDMINISLKFKSIAGCDCIFKFNPKTVLNQHLLNPTKPKKFDPNNKIIHVNGATSSNPL